MNEQTAEINIEMHNKTFFKKDFDPFYIFLEFICYIESLKNKLLDVFNGNNAESHKQCISHLTRNSIRMCEKCVIRNVFIAILCL